jgi:hypothetical protein
MRAMSFGETLTFYLAMAAMALIATAWIWG